MITTKTVISQITFCFDGSVSLQLKKQILNDGEEMHSEYHRIAFDKEADVTYLLEEVDKHLSAVGYEFLPKEEQQRIERLVNFHKTSF